ncbi:MAG TPA: PhzF family phenazine biosynthesis protein [Polyangiales bacterium]
MPALALYQVDAFTRRAFAGNPAAVCPLEQWLDDATLRAIAAEMNLSETAFCVARGQDYELRWFTPTLEIELCGHATLASALVLFQELGYPRDTITFHSLSGALHVRRVDDEYELDFPAREATPAHEQLAEVGAALGARPCEVWRATDRLLALFADAAEVRALRPNMRLVKALPLPGLVATALASGADSDVDFVSRYFAPAKGVPEDPVTGSAHCVLAPFWHQRLQRPQLRARQVSARGGELTCVHEGERVKLRGAGVLVMRGTLQF